MLTLNIGKQVSFTNDKFAKFLYFCFPKETESSELEELETTEPFETLEVQHYQTLIHKNFVRLFGDELRYFDPETQNEKDGHYDTQEVGAMDFLCVDKNNDFVVIEIKRKASDHMIGQICRYMGWVQENLCKGEQKVKGLILADSFDTYLKYALKVLNNIDFRGIELSISIEKISQ